MFQQKAEDPMTTIRSHDRQTVPRVEQPHESAIAETRHRIDDAEVKNRELARRNRFADVGQVAAHMAREIRDNLVPVSLYLSLLRRRLVEDSGNLDILAKVEAGFASLDATVSDLVSFTSDRAPQRQTFSLRAVVDDVLVAVQAQLTAQRVRTEVDVPERIIVHADYNMIRRATLNLVVNAIESMPNGGDLVVTGFDGPCGVELEVADSGPGLSSEARRRAFEPFYSTKCDGAGLGLAVVQRLVELHGGSVQCTNCPEGGAAFTLHLSRPCAWEAAA
jgi:signal transduction histidine kinase